MEAGPLSVRTIFGQDRRHLVPLFQRPYVWTREDQWEPLWEDVQTVADRLASGKPARSHFLGAIVLDQISRATGKIETRYIIDGQQRLTTLQVMLEAFSDTCRVEGLEDHHRAMLKLTRNDDPMSHDPDEKFKVWPTNVDQEAFRRVMEFSSPADLRKSYGISDGDNTDHPIADAYLFFCNEIRQWVGPGTDGFEKRINALLDTVREYLKLVVIDLDREDDAQLIFETLNARGTPLLPSDLVKNLLFHRAQVAGQKIEPLYERYWKPFDDDHRYWRRKIGRGHAQRPRIDLFLQYYLTAHVKDEVPVTHLYAAFQEFAAKNSGPEKVLSSLRNYARTYRSLEDFEPTTREGLFFDRLSHLDVTTAYPFLLEVFALKDMDRDELLQILDDLESFLVRRMLCRLSTRGYNRLFIELLIELGSGGKGAAGRIRQKLLSSDADTNRWPKDEELKTAWLTSPLYDVLTKKKRIRLVLEAIELKKRTGKTEDVPLGKKLTIEHLLPQRWQAYWPLPKTRNLGKQLERRERRLHTLGNLTLLTERLNPSVSNGAWKKKREQIIKHSVLRLNNELSAYDTWDEKQIEARGKELFTVARKLWLRPD